MNQKIKVALYVLLTLALSGLLGYLIYVAWNQDVNAARQILLATTIFVGAGAIVSAIFTVIEARKISKQTQYGYLR